MLDSCLSIWLILLLYNPVLIILNISLGWAFLIINRLQANNNTCKTKNKNKNEDNT